MKATVQQGIWDAVDKLENPLESEDSLKHLCRKAISKHLIMLNPREHLFYRVQELGLPSILNDYMLYYKSLDTNKH